MPYIDFDDHFTVYLREWLEENQDKFEDISQIERMMPELYDQFANTPAPWLEGMTPAGYFEGIMDPDLLVGMMTGYLIAEVPLPDLLLQRIIQMGAAAERPLMEVMLDELQDMEARMLCIHLLQDIGSRKPMQVYITWQINREFRDDLADFSLECLEEMGEEAVPFMLEALEEANEEGREALLSVLSRYPGHPEVYDALILLFDALPERQAILAAYLGRLGDERALPVLMERACEEGLKYLDYIELRAAIEALGGEAPAVTFDEDPEYEAIQGIN